MFVLSLKGVDKCGVFGTLLSAGGRAICGGTVSIGAGLRDRFVRGGGTGRMLMLVDGSSTAAPFATRYVLPFAKRRCTSSSIYQL